MRQDMIKGHVSGEVGLYLKTYHKSALVCLQAPGTFYILMEKEVEKSPSEILCRDLFSSFTKKYEPTSKMSEADLYLSTSQIHSEIVSHVSDEGITELMVYSMLKELGFSDTILDGSPKFLWLLKYKNL